MNRMRALAIVPLLACGGTVTNTDGGLTDSATPDGTAKDGSSDVTLPPFDAGAFCTGTAPRMMVNGSELAVLNVSGKSFVLNCCESGELFVSTSAYQAVFSVLWRSPGGSSSPVDLGNAPAGFTIELDLGCDPATTSCASASPEERYASGFTGQLAYVSSSSGLTASYCLSAAESPSTPHPSIHSLAIYAPNVASPF